MTAEIICVGTEILLGNIVNTNAAYLSERLAALGISVFETTVGDNPETGTGCSSGTGTIRYSDLIGRTGTNKR